MTLTDTLTAYLNSNRVHPKCYSTQELADMATKALQFTISRVHIGRCIAHSPQWTKMVRKGNTFYTKKSEDVFVANLYVDRFGLEENEFLTEEECKLAAELKVESLNDDSDDYTFSVEKDNINVYVAFDGETPIDVDVCLDALLEETPNATIKEMEITIYHYEVEECS